MRRDSVSGTLTVATILCVVCSIIVSGAAVGLRPLQETNKSRYRQQNILIAAGMKEQLATQTIKELFENIETQLIDLETGELVPSDVVDAKTYDQRKASKDPLLSVEIPPERDLANIRRREKYSFVYLLKEGGAVKKVILPVYGKGLWSTLYGFLALQGDLNTVAGLTFYEHKETPGLGGEVDNPRWKANWTGKLLRDEEGALQIEVLKGQVDAGSADADYQIDGLSGATVTSRGVTQLVRYWIEYGFGPYLAKLQAEGTSG